MNYLRAIGDGLVIAGIYILTVKRKPQWKMTALAIGLIYSILSVWFIYRGQENSNYFFWHPYISWMMVNVFDYTVNKKKWKEKVLLWPFVILPIIAGFELAVSWLMKLYIR